MNDNSSKILDVDINEILPNRFQPRRQFDEEEILELSDSIKEHGIIQPIVVRTIGDKYEIIAGERRYKASVLAGKESVPVIIKNLNDKDSAEVALIENIQRKNLTPIEEALSYKKILDLGYITQEKLALKLGKSQSAIANKIRLLNLSDDVQEALLENKISERHARSLLRLKSNKLQKEMLERIITERLTVRRTDEEINKINNAEILIEEEKETKGEIDMNNNVTQEFDIFGTGMSQNNVNPQSVIPTVPVMEPQPAVQPMMGGINFDANGVVTSVAPQQSVMPEPIIPVEPVMEPQPAVQPMMGGINFDANGVVTSVAPQQSVMPEPIIPVAPVMEPQPAVQPMMDGINFDANGVVTSVAPQQSVMPEPIIPVEPVMEAQPVVQPMMDGINFDANGVVTSVAPQQPVMPEPIMPTSVVPETSPIIEQTTTTPIMDNNLFMANPLPAVEPQPVVSEMPMESNIPEPIIITDYNKQYDPIMPQTAENVTPVVDFKEVISAIRECSSKIEQYGFKIDVEEFDLSSMYQVIFKIEK